MVDTKLLAYESIQHDLQRRELEVLQAISKLGAPTCKMIALDMGVDCCQVTGRIDKLRDKELIEKDGHRTNPGSGKLAEAYKVSIKGWEYLRAQVAA